MLQSLMIGICGVIGLMIVWGIVQSYWRDTFPEDVFDEDVLAGRSSCGNCGCTTQCEMKN